MIYLVLGFVTVFFVGSGLLFLRALDVLDERLDEIELKLRENGIY